MLLIPLKKKVDLVVCHIQGYSKWLSGYNWPAAIPYQIREITTIWQFHLKVICRVSRDRVRVYPRTKVRIRTSIETVWNELDYRVYICRITKVCTYRAPVRYVTKTWSAGLLKKITYTPISSVFCITSF